MSRTEAVSIAEIKAGKGPIVYNVFGLGSCVAICILDQESKTSVVGHVMLPKSFAGKQNDQPGKFADTAVPEMVHQLTRLGGSVEVAVVTYVGGAQVFQFTSGDSNRLDIGSRNVQAVDEALNAAGLTVIGQDVGGSAGRSVMFNTTTGIVAVRSFARGEKELCNLRGESRKAA